MARSTLYPIPLLIATLLAAHGLRKGSLSSSGAIAAFLVGYFHLACPLKFFGVSLIAFYLLGSRATKVKLKEKAKVEDGVEVDKPGGNRDAIQVLSNSLPTLLAALVYRFQYSSYVSLSRSCTATHPLSRPLIFLALGHFATSLADTLASELGILATSRPFHILTLTPVPKGTNGGISPLGLSVSLLGGLIMGLAGVVDLYFENPACGAVGWGWAIEVLLFSTAAGLAGSLLDSLLGATMQQTLYSLTEKKILTDKSRIPTQREREVRQIVKIGYGTDILSNSGVNFVSTGIMAGIGFWYGGGRFGILGL